MGYPVSYRNGARKYQAGGFQNPVKVPPGTRPPRPANDNWRPPANDNDPGAGAGGSVRLPKSPPYIPPIDIPAEIERQIEIRLPPPMRTAVQVAKTAYQLYDWYRNPVQFPEIDLGDTWQLQCGPAPITYRGPFAWFPGNINRCGLGGQAGRTSPLPVSDRVETAWNLVKHDRYNLSDPAGRWQIIQAWKRIKPYSPYSPYGNGPIVKWGMYPIAPAAVPNPVPATVANPMPAQVPAPVGNVVPAARPMPATVPVARPAAYVYARPQSNVRPDHWPKPGPQPGPVVVVGPGQATNHVRKPPGPGVKERKVRASGAIAGALGVAAGIYEDAKFYNDVLNAWYDALPGKKSAKTPAQKALELYRRADEIDVQKAIINVLIAVAGEKAGGYIDRARRKAGDNLGLNMYISIPTGSAPRV